MDLDKAPFFVTLAVAIAGWSATYVVGRITGSPTLEYEAYPAVASPQANESAAMSQTLRLTNLTRSTTFKSLSIVLMAPPGTKILDAATDVVAVPPAFEGNEPWKFRGGMARYVIPKVHPGWTYLVRVGFVGPKSPTLRFESEDNIYTTRPNWETFVVRHEFWILAVIGGFWSVFILWYFAANVWQYLSASQTARAEAIAQAKVTSKGDDDATG